MKLKLIYKTTDLQGRVNSAKMEADNGKVFEWSLRGGLKQWIDHPVSNAMGHGDYYLRRAGKRLNEQAEELLIKLGHLEGRGQRHQRLAKEAIGF